MPKVRAGALPWTDRYKRATKATTELYEHSFSSGWRPRRYEDSWKSTPGKPKMKVVRYRGRNYKIPDNDYEDYIGHLASPPSDPDSEIGKYVAAGYEGITDEQEAEAGHIAKVEYNSRRQLLFVTFESDGALVVFFTVPKEVYYELAYLAETMTGHMEKRYGEWVFSHNLGIRFWDIVRIRGNYHGTRYRFEYMQHGERTGSAMSHATESDTESLDMFSRMLKGDDKAKYEAAKTADEKQQILIDAGIMEKEDYNATVAKQLKGKKK